ncbi:conserved hypothetical protein [Arthrobacter sp. 9AX]|uniref:hypothetical protein n=1 Tax=Arthrobacter sp. 9AX TaxID=2653131 RepID=UPI0012F0B774|nr:hypothetical protein [Arthrobacter sp. 9AX]VXC57083.1 conserved hypothetical protein [Arthrobacter sp. 9AX]
MTTSPSSYLPYDQNQPRGHQPWCPGCDTDVYLIIESPAVQGRQTGTLAVAVRCSNCRQSRVLDTTREHLSALTHRSARYGDLVHRDNTYFHCGEPMVPAGPRPETSLRTFPAENHSPPEASLAAYFATKVLRCRCGFQMELPR